ncbi:type II toxin-antitoxin system RelE/ParE family toxin [Pseudidiomarina homiensis]|uniref:type II toxin-antitoxin system RelE/ParE family toxin n=1 Tax=Pseudidiomarina homiensis TaxID=364198 RepID=UPI00215B3D3F|nr:type II toxin-antitoxin system RelE/ParE family toxin [Pseudidiomarina homiensis]
MKLNQVINRKAKEYMTRNGGAPFSAWLAKLKDVRGQAKVTKAITQMEAGNFGDYKSIKQSDGLYERRINFGPGYRIYYMIDGDNLIILFAGSTKSDQQKVIQRAKVYLTDYKVRKNEGDQHATN